MYNLSRIFVRVVRTSAVKKYNILNRLASKMPKQFDKEELKKKLTTIQYHVTQEKGTERPFSGCYNKFKTVGTYLCVVCEEPLFTSDTKFDSGCGWPAFKDVIDQGRVKLTTDTSADIHPGDIIYAITQSHHYIHQSVLGMIRTEVTCAQCGAHLGHVFDDGPPPKKTRYCINSASMNFIPKDDQETTDKQTGDS